MVKSYIKKLKSKLTWRILCIYIGMALLPSVIIGANYYRTVSNYLINEEKDLYREAVAAGKQKQDDFGIGVWIFGDQGDESAFVDYAATDPDQIDYIARLRSGTAHTTVMSELYFAIPTSGDELNIYNSLNDMYNSEFLKVIFAETDEEYQAALDSMYQQAKQLGIDKLEEWMRNAVAEHLNNS